MPPIMCLQGQGIKRWRLGEDSDQSPGCLILESGRVDPPNGIGMVARGGIDQGLGCLALVLDYFQLRFSFL